jgi:hypothetical protein
MRFEQIDENTIRASLGTSIRSYRLEESGQGRWDLKRSNLRIGMMRQSPDGFRITVAIGGRTLAGTFPTEDQALASAAELCEWRRERTRFQGLVKQIEQAIEKLELRVAEPNPKQDAWETFDFSLGLPNVDSDLKVEILRRRLPKIVEAIERIDASFEQKFRATDR